MVAAWMTDAAGGEEFPTWGEFVSAQLRGQHTTMLARLGRSTLRCNLQSGPLG